MDENILLATFESAMMHMQKVNKRISFVATVAILVVGLMFCTFMYFLTNYEITAEQVTVDSKDGPANYIGNDNNGEVNNGNGDGQENNDQEEK